MDEVFSLKWNDFSSNVTKSFNQLQKEKDFFDITLVSSDEVHFQSHKMILATSSPFFKNIIKKNSHSYPMIFLSGISAANIQQILDYVYQGEVQVRHDQIDHFLDAASKLKILGLEIPENSPNIDDTEKIENVEFSDMIGFQDIRNTSSLEEKKLSMLQRNDIDDSPIERTFEDDIDLDKLREQVSEQIDSINGVPTCKICKKQTRDNSDLKYHIEMHIDGIQLTCRICFQKFNRTRSLKNHTRKVHYMQ